MERKGLGALAKSNAARALALPLLAKSCKCDLRAVTTAISDMAKMPFAMRSKKIAIISSAIVDTLPAS